MKYVIRLIRKHHKKAFHLPSVLIVLGFLVIAIIINAVLEIEDHYIDEVWAGSPVRILWYFLLFALPFYVSCYVLHRYGLIGDTLRTRHFYTASLFVLIVMSVDSSFSYHHPIIRAVVRHDIAYWVTKCCNNLKSLLTIIVPLAVFYTWSREKNHFYGLSKGISHWTSYLWLLLLVAPLVIFASFTEGFLDAYPRYAPIFRSSVPGWVRVFVYELTYAFDFVTTELLFRGFLVIGMARILGPHAILPMAAVYCFYHFGKPPLEAFSSIFGGYILGILAYYSRSIIGGIILHVGLAWMMELAAWLQK